MRVGGRGIGVKIKKGLVRLMSETLAAVGLGTLMFAVGLLVGSGQAGAVSPGYWLSAGDGGVFSFNAPFWGSPASDPTNCPPASADRDDPFGTCSVMAARPDGQGYWILDSALSKVFAYGKASNLGQPWDYYQSLPFYQVPTGVGIVSTPSGNGYWVAESNGKVFAYGDAQGYGDASGLSLNASIVGMAATADGHGYWLVASDGGVFSFGDAGYYGSMGGHHLNQAVVGMAANLETGGYWLVAADGGIFSFNAPFSGSMGGTQLNQPMVGMAANPDGPGYWTVASDGGIFSFGGAPFLGSMGGQHLNSPIFGIAATP
jgi:hypothetical protein